MTEGRYIELRWLVKADERTLQSRTVRVREGICHYDEWEDVPQIPEETEGLTAD